MPIREFENKLEEDERKISTHCKYHVRKILELQRELLHLPTVLGLVEEVELWQLRARLRCLFVDHLYVVGIHFVSFLGRCEYRNFWEVKGGVITNEDGPTLFCRRNTGTID